MKTLSDKMNIDWDKEVDGAYVITKENMESTNFSLILDYFNIDESEICEHDLEGCSIIIEDNIKHIGTYDHNREITSKLLIWFD